MKKNKLLLIVSLVFLITGCSANYNLKIYLDGTIKERVILLEEKNNIINPFNEDDFNKYIENVISINSLRDKIDGYENIIEKNEAGVELNNSYISIMDYKNNNQITNYLFNGIKVEEKNGIVSIKTIPSDYEVLLDEEENLKYKNSSITISLPFKVINHNANEVDEVTNSYTWKIDEDFKGIELEYNNMKVFNYDLLRLFSYANGNTYFYLFIYSLVLIAVALIIFLGIKLLRKEKNL